MTPHISREHNVLENAFQNVQLNYITVNYGSNKSWQILMIHENGAFRELRYKTPKKGSRKCSLNTRHRWPQPKLQRHDNKWTSLQPELRQWQSPFPQTSSAGTLVREEWGIWGRLLQQCLSNNGMTWAWLISKPGQKPFSTSKFTDSCRSNLLSICTHRTDWVNKDSCIKFECAHTHTGVSVGTHLCEGEWLCMWVRD